jgi:hypothetical protein
MTSQLRIYRIKPGAMDAFIALWREHIVPARQAYGFTVDGAWVTLERDEFAWIVSHEGDEGFQAADQAYYDSPERAALPQDPGDHIEDMQLRMMEPVSG